MVLIDTSVLIAYLKGVESVHTKTFQHIMDNRIPFGINTIIYQEVLQGVKTEKDFGIVKEYLDTQKFYGLKDDKESYASAARIYFALRRKGITGGTIDCLIAQCAIDNDLYLLHSDSDFDRMSRTAGLKIFRL